MNRIGHPDWVKLCVELNCAPNQNTFCYISIKDCSRVKNLFDVHHLNLAGCVKQICYFHLCLFVYLYPPQSLVRFDWKWVEN